MRKDATPIAAGQITHLQEKVKEDGNAGVYAEVLHHREGRGTAQHEGGDVCQGCVFGTTTRITQQCGHRCKRC